MLNRLAGKNIIVSLIDIQDKSNCDCARRPGENHSELFVRDICHYVNVFGLCNSLTTMWRYMMTVFIISSKIL